MQQQISIKCVDRKSVKTECNCDCCQGRCNHAATPCHRPYEVVERWEITLPNGETLSKSLSFRDDDWKHRVVPGIAGFVREALEERGYRVFEYRDICNDFYYYSTTTWHDITPIRGDVWVMSADGIRARGPWFGPTNALDETVKFVIVPPSVEEAEWEVVEWGQSNVPHNVEVEVEDENGETYIMLEQCWCRREWRLRERVVFRRGEVISEVLESWERCEKRNNQ